MRKKMGKSSCGKKNMKKGGAVKMRGTGCAKKGTMSRGPMA
jgi:hypothetical protein